MLPTNVMSFMKKMVATDGAGATTEAPDAGSTFGKLRQTLSSSLMTAQDKVTMMKPRASMIPGGEAEAAALAVAQAAEPTPTPAPAPKPEPGKPPSRAGACRVCLKSFKPEDFSRTCSECTQRVCEDCASYSKLDENEDQSAWKCSVCRRKLQSRICIPQDSTDSLLDVPVLEALQRRHSDVKLGGGNSLSAGGGGGLGLAPPRSPELRRHSDVSPASLKELEKLKGGTKSQAGSSGELDWAGRGRGSRSGAPSRSSSPPRRDSCVMVTNAVTTPAVTTTMEPPAGATRQRRMSRVQRQHSYDDEVKPGGGAPAQEATGLGLPAPMPRRASAYDVYAPGVLAAANAAVTSERPLQSRRPSFRVPPPDEPVKDSSPSPEACPTLIIEDDRRNRRRASQLPDIAALRALPQTPWSAAALEEMEAPRRQASVDGEAIKIVIHDVDSGLPITAAKRRVVLRRDPTDKAHRTRGFGMRVVGGKTGTDGRLFAYIVWTVPGGPAEKGGLQQGDKVLEWCGVPLTDRSFEEVCAIMDRTGDVAELLVEHATDFRMCDLLEEPMPMNRKSSDTPTPGLTEPDSEKTPSSPTRRKLPKTPEQMAREKQVSGRVQLQVWYHDERRELVVAILAGDDLAPRDDTLGFGNLPEAYAKLRLIPSSADQCTVQTEVAPASQNPIWNANLSFPGVPGDELMDKSIEMTLWDLCPQSDPVYLGECTVDLQKAFLDDRAVWCRLEDPRGMRGCPLGKSPHTSPRGSIGGDASRLMRRSDFQRSVSDDVDSIGECTSLLHPDHAWIAGSRRGSSQSEQLEVEVYQLGKDFSRSLPGSRRSSFQSAEKGGLNNPMSVLDNEEAAPPPVTYNPGRRRSSCTRMLRDPDEILRSLKAVKGELGRTMSLSNNADKRGRRTSTSSRKDSVLDIPEYTIVEPGMCGPASNEGSPEGGSPTRERKLGPGQIQPRGYRMSSGRHGELKLGLLMTKGQLEVDVVCARNLGPRYSDTPPDTYVKCYLRDGERWLQKRKTRVSRHSAEPQWRQTLRYSACDVLGRTLLVMLWERQGGFEHNQGIGGAEVALDSITLTHLTLGWYPLFPIHSLGSDSNDSP